MFTLLTDLIANILYITIIGLITLKFNKQMYEQIQINYMINKVMPNTTELKIQSLLDEIKHIKEINKINSKNLDELNVNIIQLECEN